MAVKTALGASPLSRPIASSALAASMTLHPASRRRRAISSYRSPSTSTMRRLAMFERERRGGRELRKKCKKRTHVRVALTPKLERRALSVGGAKDAGRHAAQRRRTSARPARERRGSAACQERGHRREQLLLRVGLG
jgi:hypothetical protein